MIIGRQHKVVEGHGFFGLRVDGGGDGSELGGFYRRYE